MRPVLACPTRVTRLSAAPPPRPPPPPKPRPPPAGSASFGASAATSFCSVSTDVLRSGGRSALLPASLASSVSRVLSDSHSGGHLGRCAAAARASPSPCRTSACARLRSAPLRDRPRRAAACVSTVLPSTIERDVVDARQHVRSRVTAAATAEPATAATARHRRSPRRTDSAPDAPPGPPCRPACRRPARGRPRRRTPARVPAARAGPSTPTGCPARCCSPAPDRRSRAPRGRPRR